MKKVELIIAIKVEIFRQFYLANSLVLCRGRCIVGFHSVMDFIIL